MSIAFKCNICGRLYEPYSTVEKLKPSCISINASFVYEDSVKRRTVSTFDDVCPECMDSIQKHIAELSKNKTEN